MSRTGPVCTDVTQLFLGLAQVRVGASAGNIALTSPQFSASDSIGALADTRFMGNTDWAKFESGFPLIEDYSVSIREAASLECTWNQLSPANLAMAYGLDPTTYTAAHSGEIPLGARTAPEYLRMEAVYTFPNGSNYMTIVFPRAQVTSSADMNMPREDWGGVPVTFESKNASSDATGGNAVWDTRPLGSINFT